MGRDDVRDEPVAPELCGLFGGRPHPGRVKWKLHGMCTMKFGGGCLRSCVPSPDSTVWKMFFRGHRAVHTVSTVGLRDMMELTDSILQVVSTYSQQFFECTKLRPGRDNTCNSFTSSASSCSAHREGAWGNNDDNKTHTSQAH